MPSHKLVSLVQPNFQQGPKEFNAHYLPYSVGVLWAYVQQFQDINDYYKLDQIIWRRQNIQETARKLAKSDIIGFSTYVWNKNYNFAVAKLIKQINPDAVLFFGGPEIAIARKNIFEMYPFMDYVIKSEGEITLKNFLLALKNNLDLLDIPGLLINNNGLIIDTGNSERINSLDQIPSPYLSGVFDGIMAETQGVEWNATIETNRGCPYACTFCDWGSLTYNKVKQFNLERVFNELEWIGKNQCGYLTITDANFGMFVERDNLIAEKLLEVQEKYGHPYTFSVSWAKNQKKEVVDIVKKLIKSPKFNQGLTVSVQSMDLDVLENVKRKNLEQHKIEDIFELCDQNNIPVYTEIILGLPGETLESFKQGFWKLFKAGNHTGITILHAQMLENAEMTLLQKKLYKIKHRPVYDYMSGSYNFDELKECVEVVVSTKDMNFDEMLEAHMFSWFINTFHINGLTNYISRVINKNLNIEYSTFYDRLYHFLQSDVWFVQEQQAVKKYYTNWMIDGKIDHPDISNIEVHGWNIVHRTTLKIHQDNLYEHVFTLLRHFIDKHFPKVYNKELIEFQKNYVIDFMKVRDYPVVDSYNYNFLGYLLENEKLNQAQTYKFEFPEDRNISLDRFLENIYFGRRRNFGKALIEKI